MIYSIIKPLSLFVTWLTCFEIQFIQKSFECIMDEEGNYLQYSREPRAGVTEKNHKVYEQNISYRKISHIIITIIISLIFSCASFIQYLRSQGLPQAPIANSPSLSIPPIHILNPHLPPYPAPAPPRCLPLTIPRK